MPTQLWTAMALVLFLPLSACGQNTDEKPLLSDVIRATLENEGAAAADRRFSEILRDERDDYRLDMEGLSNLGAEYMKKGDMATAQVVFEMVPRLYEETYAVPEGFEEPPPVAERAAAAESQPVRRDQGPLRDDLARFVGVYGDPAKQEQTPHNVFIDQTCDGRLRLGAMWGDVAPWVMKSLSDTEFEQARLQPYETEPIRLEFDVGADGRAQALTHTDLTHPERSMTRAVRLGDLPEWFDDCSE